MSLSIAIVNPKGGVGGTTTAIYLAAVAASKGLRVAVLDGNSCQSSGSLSWARYVPSISCFAFVENLADDDYSEDNFDLVIADTRSGAREAHVGPCVRWADLIIIPTSTSPIEVEPCVAACRWIAEQASPSVPRRVLFTRHRPQGLTAAAVKAVSAAQVETFRTVIPRMRGIADAYCYDLGPTSDGWLDHSSLWAEIEPLLAGRTPTEESDALPPIALERPQIQTPVGVASSIGSLAHQSLRLRFLEHPTRSLNFRSVIAALLDEYLTDPELEARINAGVSGR